MQIYDVGLQFKRALQKRATTEFIILHHAAASKASVTTIHNWHLQRGWTGIGYHFYVRKDGSIYRGRPEDTIGAHTEGYNSRSIGICAEGNFEVETMPDVQKRAIIELLRELGKRYPNAQIKRHKDFAATACPGKNYPLNEIIQAVNKKEDDIVLLKNGSRGDAVKQLQTNLNKLGYNAGAADGIFGSRTESAVKAFQKDNGLVVDGIVGPKTKAKLEEKLKAKSQSGNVKQLQEILTQIGIDVGKIDGIDGPKTKAGIKQFQKIFGLTVDGIAGPKTWAVINKAKGIKHFKVKEFACKHCGEIKIDINLLVKLEELRRAIGNRPIIINSGYRCPVHNRNVGGAKNSQHLYGKAADIRVPNMSPRTLEKFADTVFANGGVGMGGATIVHVDTRGYKARWRYN